jgi:hypothetical protein
LYVYTCRRSPGVTGTSPFRGKPRFHKILTVRISSEKWEEIRHEAGELGVRPGTLTRLWIMGGLRRLKKGIGPEAPGSGGEAGGRHNGNE